MSRICLLLVATGLSAAAAWAETPTYMGMPPGFELVDITEVGNYRIRPRMNDRGQIVFQLNTDPPQVLLYDNGEITQLTDDEMGGWFPDINDDGVVVWSSAMGVRGRRARSAHEIISYRDGVTTRITNNGMSDSTPRINNSGQITWTAYDKKKGFQIHYFDGDTSYKISREGRSNQGPAINNRGEVVWMDYRYDERLVTFYSEGKTTQVSPSGIDALNYAINDLGQVVWAKTTGNCISEIRLWDSSGHGGRRIAKADASGPVVIELGGGPIFNDRGDIAFQRFFHKLRKTFQAFVYMDGAIWQITNDRRVHWHAITDINSRGEFVLVSGLPGKVKIQLGRLIR